jgi:hypothetical protein
VRHFSSVSPLILSPRGVYSVFERRPAILSGPAHRSQSKDQMNPRSSNAPSEDHSRRATMIPAGLIAREIREAPERRRL